MGGDEIDHGQRKIVIRRMARRVFLRFEKDEYFLANHIKPQSKLIGPKIKRVFKYEEGLDRIVSQVLSETNVRLPGKVTMPKINTSPDFAAAVSEGDKEKTEIFMPTISNSTAMPDTKAYLFEAVFRLGRTVSLPPARRRQWSAAPY
jgi:hypothetical protein